MDLTMTEAQFTALLAKLVAATVVPIAVIYVLDPTSSFVTRCGIMIAGHSFTVTFNDISNVSQASFVTDCTLSGWPAPIQSAQIFDSVSM